MKIPKISNINNWQYNQKIKKWGNETYHTNRYQRNGLDLTVLTTYRDNKKITVAKELSDYLGNIISAKIIEFKNGIKSKQKYI